MSLRGGHSLEVLARISALETKVTALESTHGDAENYGTVKLTNAADVTESAGLALPASEKNASVDGTLMQIISQAISKINYTIKATYSSDGLGSDIGKIINNFADPYNQIIAEQGFAIVHIDVSGSYYYTGFAIPLTNSSADYFIAGMDGMFFVRTQNNKVTKIIEMEGAVTRPTA